MINDGMGWSFLWTLPATPLHFCNWLCFGESVACFGNGFKLDSGA